MKHSRHERRRSLVVNRELQKKIIFSVSLFPTVALAVATLIVAVFSRKLLGEAARAEAQLPSLVPLFLALLGFTIVAALIVWHQALRFSHRVAGPCYRFMESMKRIRSGDVSFRIKLRERDHLTEVADEFNLLLEWLDENPPPGAKTSAVELDHLGELEEVCDGRPATRDAVLAQGAGESP